MDVREQVAQQRVELEAAVAKALEMAGQKADAAEVAINKTTGISVSTRLSEVENVEFNSDGVCEECECTKIFGSKQRF